MCLSLSRPPSKSAGVETTAVVITPKCTRCSATKCHPSLYWKRTLPTTLDACKLECVVLFNVCVSVIQPLSCNQVTLPEKGRSYSIVHLCTGEFGVCGSVVPPPPPPPPIHLFLGACTPLLIYQL